MRDRTPHVDGAKITSEDTSGNSICDVWHESKPGNFGNTCGLAPNYRRSYSLAPTAAKSNRPTTSNLDDTKGVPSLAATKERRGDLREIASGSVSSMKAEGGKFHDV